MPKKSREMLYKQGISHFHVLIFFVLLVSLIIIASVVSSRQNATQTQYEAGCTICSGTGYSCSGNILYRCVDKCLHEVKSCNAPPLEDKRTCNASQKTCINKCVHDDTRCYHASNGYERWEECVGDTWNITMSCKYNEHCGDHFNTCYPD
jgi:hypothetical protein